jgi:hypothetical protein
MTDIYGREKTAAIVARNKQLNKELSDIVPQLTQAPPQK